MTKRIFSMVLAIAVMATMLASFTITANAVSSGSYKEDFTNALDSGLSKIKSTSTVKYEIDDGSVNSELAGTLKVTFESAGQNNLDVDIHNFDGTQNIVLEYDIMFPVDSDSKNPSLTVYLTAGNVWYTATKSGYAYMKDGKWWHYRSVFTSNGTKLNGHTGTRVLRDAPGATPEAKNDTATDQKSRGVGLQIICNTDVLGKTFWLDNIVCYSGLSISDTSFKLGGTAIDEVAASTTAPLAVTTNVKYGENSALEGAQALLVAFDASGMMLDCKTATYTINPAGTNNGETAVSVTTDDAINIDDIAKTELYLWNSIAEQQPLIEAVTWKKP